MRRLIPWFILVMLVIVVYDSSASNLVISDVSKISNRIKFRIKWDYSWRGTLPKDPHDAIWVFIKARDCVAGSNRLPFGHVRVEGIGAITGNIVNNPLRQPIAENFGVIIRKSDLQGSSADGTIELVTTLPTSGNLEIRVFGIEMTYIQGGEFSIGDGFAYKTFGQGNNAALPFKITSENAVIEVGTQLASQLTESRRDKYELASEVFLTANIPASYPKGVNHFYCMKTEITQKQYADFLNTISFEQFVNRYEPPSRLYTLDGNWPGIQTGGHPNRACSDLSYQDLIAYLDWAGLRPMTEFEFEKVCRGPLAPVGFEFANGKLLYVKPETRIVNEACSTPEDISETVSNRGIQGVVNYGVGLAEESTFFLTMDAGFLINPDITTNSRLTTGAGYYGNLELSGNLAEFVISTLAEGLVYNGIFGDGTLTQSGSANQQNWPLNVKKAIGWKGGDFVNTEHHAVVSYRSGINVPDPSQRYGNTGGRGIAIATVQ